jgi:hypothetical protein
VKRVFTFRGCFAGLGEQTEDEVSMNNRQGRIFSRNFQLAVRWLKRARSVKADNSDEFPVSLSCCI